MSATWRGRRVKVAASNREVLAPPYEWTTAAFMALDHDAWRVPQMLSPADAERAKAAYQPPGRGLWRVMCGASLTEHDRSIEVGLADLDGVLDELGVLDVAWPEVILSLARHRRRRYRAAVSGLGLLHAAATRTPECACLNQAGQNQVTDAIFAALHSLLEVMQSGRTVHAKTVVTEFGRLDALLGKISVRPVFPLPECVVRAS